MKLRTLGGLELTGSDFYRPKPLLLLAYLALEGAKPKRHLAELFWPSGQRMKSLSMTLSRLRNGAPGSVENDGARVWTGVETDAVTLLAKLESGELDEALALYRGPFLDGVYLPDWGVELEEWVYETREFLAERVREAFLSLAEGEAARNRLKVAVKHAEAAYKLAGAPPLDPVAVGRAYPLLLAGESLLAVQLRREAESLGLTLTPSAEAARSQLRDRSGPAETPTPHALPTRATSFVGRDLELTEVGTLLADPDCRLVTLIGTAGVGKTRLAVQVAQEQLKFGGFKDGVHFVSLQPLAMTEMIPSALADALGVDLEGPEEPLKQIMKGIGDGNLLLVLDNFEHLVAASTMLSDLVTACKGLTLLVTSRERLHLEEEQTFPIEGLPFPGDEEAALDQAQHADAVRLFVQRAGRARSDFSLTEDVRPFVIRICRLTEGLPLAIELAASWVTVMTCRDIAAELEHDLDLLTTRLRNVPEEHRSIRIAFEKSWELLTAKEQQVLRRLSVFRGGFRRQAASEVAGASIPILASLVDKSLLRLSERGRYDSHPLIHQYAAEKLAENPQEAFEIRDKHLTFYSRCLTKWGRELVGTGREDAVSALEDDFENTLGAWQWALLNLRIEDLKRATESLLLFFGSVSRYRLGEDIFANAAALLNADDADQQELFSSVLTAEAWMSFRLGDYERAQRLSERGVAMARPLGYWRAISRGLTTLAAIARQTGNFGRAKAYCAERLALFRDMGDRRLLPGALNQLATVEKALGDYVAAERLHREALALDREFGAQASLVNGLCNLGSLLCDAGRYQEAIEVLHEGLELAKTAQAHNDLPLILVGLGEACFAVGRHDESQGYCHEALQIARDGALQAEESEALTVLAKVSLVRGNHQEAKGLLEHALERAWAINYNYAVMEILMVLARWHRERGQPERGATLANLVLLQQTAQHCHHVQAEQFLAGVGSRLSPYALAQSLERAKTMALHDVVTEVLNGKLPYR